MLNIVCPSCKKKLIERKKTANKIYCSNKNCRYFKKSFDKLDHLPILIPFEEEYCILDSNSVLDIIFSSDCVVLSSIVS